MPKEMHERLKRTAKKKFGTTTSKQARRYIYGTMLKAEGNPHTTTCIISAEGEAEVSIPNKTDFITAGE